MKSYHNHTIFSDGQNTVEEMVSAAVALGMEEFGMSDHYVRPYDGLTFGWSMPEERLPEYFAELDRVAAKFAGKIVLKRGLEADYSPQTIDYVRDFLKTLPLDYLIGSVHQIDDFPIDDRAEYWERISQAKRNDIIAEYWERMTVMAGSGVFQIAGHLDLYKKFGYFPTVDMSDRIEQTLDAVADTGMVMELNTAGWHKPVGEQYPSVDILLAADKREIPVVVNGDAHRPEHILRDFDKAYKLLEEIGYKKIPK
ncbi:MAG: histidinol-phosphatase [Abditibacteriota bacterium]|nr:histidinol-phosphatase [Abditibacteriota bacterium]MBP5719340.1 histidinol-phosphatase [Abditibacteriota bacterium]